MNWTLAVSDLEKLGWSLTGLGRAIGLSPQAVSDIKQGRTKAPTGMAAVELYHLHRHRVPPPGADANSQPGASGAEAA